MNTLTILIIDNNLMQHIAIAQLKIALFIDRQYKKN